MGKMSEVVGEQRRDVGGALAEGGEVYLHHAEAVKKVFPEAALGDGIKQVFVCGADKACVHLDGFVGAQTFEGACFEKAEEFDLGEGVYFADFVEEERSAVCGLEAPDAAFDRPGEGAFFVAEELAFEKGCGEGGAVCGDKWGTGTRAVVVYHSGEKFLACACLAKQEDCGARGCDLACLGHHAREGGAATDDARRFEFFWGSRRGVSGLGVGVF